MHNLPKEQIHPSVFVADGATVVGDVHLAEDASVWFGAVLRGDCAPIRVGARSNVQDLCMLHADPGWPCTVGEGVTIGHAAIVHGATVGNNCVIGMKSVIQNGVTIGDNCIIAVGAVVTEGTQIPPGQLVMGLPAKIKRPLTEQEIQHSQLSAAHYVENAHQFRAAQQEKIRDEIGK